LLALVLAGGAGGRLELLTEQRAKPAVPFAGVYRLVDFPLSSCQHSGLSDVWVLTQFHPVSLAEHLANGRPWDLDRSVGGMLTLPPYRGDEREGWHEGTADALWRYADLVRAHRADVLLVMSADAAYRLDYAEVADAHRQSGRGVTIVTSEVPVDEAGRYGVVQTRGDRVSGYAYKPDDPAGGTVACEVFAFSPSALLDTLDDLAATVGDDGLADLGHHLLPTLVDGGEAAALPLEGYWQDVGTVDAYWQAHREFVQPEPPLDLDDPAWPVHTRGGRSSAARVLPGAQVDQSLLGGGCRVGGTVSGSVLSPGVVVEAGATVVDSVLLPGARVCAGATVERAVVDDAVEIGPDAHVGGAEQVTLLGRRWRVPPGTVVPAGARAPEEPAGSTG
jgi:glucose-1-phosphate adenylyltransferase